MLIDDLRESTYKEALGLLNEHGKCIIVRPTGFGKTGILTRVIREGGYSKILYLYPSQVVKDAVFNFYYGSDTQAKEIPNVTFVSYSKISRENKKSIKNYAGYDLVIADEAHRLGAFKVSRGINLLLSESKAKFLGATATPERMDLIDIVSLFFDNHVVSEYTLHNAFQDGILQKPYYCFCSYKGESSNVAYATRLEIDKMDSKEDRREALKLLKARLIEISRLGNMENVIKDTCEKYIKDLSYMRFIVFFSSFENLHDKSSSVKGWFTTAFPDKQIRELIVSSESQETRKNVFKLASLDSPDGVIDLIYSCDLLDMGYHVDNLTGICMYRGTGSGIVFSQQLGRVLSSGSCVPGIVFDIVDNIHRESAYRVLDRKSQKIIKRKERFLELKAKLESGIDLSKQELKEYRLLSKSFSRRGWWVTCNQLKPEDLISVGYEATYRELIAKTVAEPISMRCRQAWARWVEKGGSPDPRTKEHILGQKAPFNTPLDPFCRLKRVSVRNVLDVMGVTN